MTFSPALKKMSPDILSNQLNLYSMNIDNGCTKLTMAQILNSIK